MKQEDGKGIGDPVHKYYSFPSEARDFSRERIHKLALAFVSLHIVLCKLERCEPKWIYNLLRFLGRSIPNIKNY